MEKVPISPCLSTEGEGAYRHVIPYITVIWEVTPCSLVDHYQCFERMCCLQDGSSTFMKTLVNIYEAGLCHFLKTVIFIATNVRTSMSCSVGNQKGIWKTPHNVASLEPKASDMEVQFLSLAIRSP